MTEEIKPKKDLIPSEIMKKLEEVKRPIFPPIKPVSYTKPVNIEVKKPITPIKPIPEPTIKTKIIDTTDLEKVKYKYDKKIELEKLRHQNVMEEIKILQEAKIQYFARYHNKAINSIEPPIEEKEKVKKEKKEKKEKKQKTKKEKVKKEKKLKAKEEVNNANL